MQPDFDGELDSAEHTLLSKVLGPQHYHNERHRRINWLTALVSSIAVAVTFVTCNMLLNYMYAPTCHCKPAEDIFSTGFTTDFAGSKPSIAVQTVTFTGSVLFAADGTKSLPASPYVGNPGSAQEDTAWDALIWGTYFHISEAEARHAWGDKYTAFWNADENAYVGGFDMFHALHCLNEMRKALRPELYGGGDAVHLDHCLDHLRQMVQCSGDMTLLPTQYRPGAGHNYIRSDRQHTCRDFGRVREWLDQRNYEQYGMTKEEVNITEIGVGA